MGTRLYVSNLPRAATEEGMATRLGKLGNGFSVGLARTS
jgi:hypothetical protein